MTIYVCDVRSCAGVCTRFTAFTSFNELKLIAYLGF